ncbi:MAG: autorepressor SdpR family transcription factor [Peptoniphilus sp.]|nr:autorepressor SdpR family transcription factor [Peptoniphilus sp.]
MNLEKTFKALADKTRREILNMLRDGPLSAGEISDKFNMSKATTSYHLSILKDADLIIDNKEKNFIIYSLNASIFEEVVGYIMNFLERDQV